MGYMYKATSIRLHHKTYRLHGVSWRTFLHCIFLLNLPPPRPNTLKNVLDVCGIKLFPFQVLLKANIIRTRKIYWWISTTWFVFIIFFEDRGLNSFRLFLCDMNKKVFFYFIAIFCLTTQKGLNQLHLNNWKSSSIPSK